MRAAIAALAAAFAIGALAPNARAQSCYDYYNRSTYGAGFSAASFSTQTDVTLGGAVQLNVALTPLDPQNIVLPFDQDVKVKYVYRNAAASHSLGWFYASQISQFIDNTGHLKDADNDGVPDWFQTQSGATRPYDGLWHISSGGTPDLANSSKSYSDGGTYPHIPNVLETAIQKGGMIFQLCDDDTDLSTWGNYAPVADSSATNDGVPDYDVNGDGSINASDRTVDLGTIKGNQEIVFFAMTYYDATLNNRGVGLTGASTLAVKMVPWFTKDMLNPDSGSRTAGTVIQKIAIGCARDDSNCYSPLGATLGWLDAATITRLNTPAYGNLVLDNTVRNVTVDSNGSTPHFVVAAPSTDPTRWVLAFDDQPEYKTAPGNGSCTGGCTSDGDYDDVVFTIERYNGGEVVSNDVTSEIPASQRANVTLSKVHFAYTASYPAPCSALPNSRINMYYSVDGGTSWFLAGTLANGSGDLVVDLLQQDISGNQLKWKADFITDTNACQPKISSLNVGYEALQHGEYFFSEQIPVANALFRGSLETYGTTWTLTNNDRTDRGHFESYLTYDPSTDQTLSPPTQKWDAGAVLQSTSPDARKIYWGTSGATFVDTNASLPLLVLPQSDRIAKQNGTLVYDFNGDGAVDDNDAKFVIDWTRGWETSGVQRAWKLGAIDHSSPALFGPSSHPWWVDGAGTPSAEKTAYVSFATTYATRKTLAVVGSQDGLIHAFNAGSFRYGDDPTTTQVETHGYFLSTSGVRDYGDGKEVWAFVPTSNLDNLKSNHPKVAGYQNLTALNAVADGAITIADTYYSGALHTVAVAPLGTLLPQVALLDVSDATTAKSVWSADWGDTDFNGTAWAAAIGPTTVGGTRKHVVAVTSGTPSVAKDLYLYLVDVAAGTTDAKTKINVGSASAQSYGMYGSPAMIDTDGDGVVDRVYVADTNGNLSRVDTATNTVCLVASMGETLYAPIAVQQTQTQPPAIRIYAAGGDSPDSTDTAGTFHYFAFEDDDAIGACVGSKHVKVFSAAMTTGSKVWSAPTVDNGVVYFATSTSAREDLCEASASNPGQVVGFSTTPDGNGNAVSAFAPISLGASTVVGGLRAVDGHLVAATMVGGTTILGGSTWNNTPTGSGTAQTTPSPLPTVLWYEQ